VRFDLQSHSICSDGALAPEDVVARAAAAGVELLALTDHDTVAGVADARRAAVAHGIRLTPAAELSSVDGTHEDLHVLGYELDVSDPDLETTLTDFRADRERRVLAMADKLRELGFQLADEVLEQRRAAGAPLGRPHLADALLRHPANADRLAEEGATELGALFERYLIPGGLAYVARSRPTVAEAIEVIHRAGGVAVWAHPFWDLDDPGETLAAIDRFRASGLDGVEVFYRTHTEEQTLLLHEHCVEHGLLATGSADFHAPDHGRFHTFMAFELYGREPILGPIGAAA
jgi:predicted metal-dependent phosphoesterase TrpH